MRTHITFTKRGLLSSRPPEKRTCPSHTRPAFTAEVPALLVWQPTHPPAFAVRVSVSWLTAACGRFSRLSTQGAS